MTNNSNQQAKNIGVAFFLNFGFTILEIFGGLLTNSMAILSDALHDLRDSLSLGISWYLQKKSKKQNDQKFSFGYDRFSLLGALLSGLVLILGSFFILYQAIPRIFNPEHTNSTGMLLLSIGGIIVKCLQTISGLLHMTILPFSNIAF